MAESAGEKTELPTPKKLRDARQKGQVCSSKDIVSTAILIVLFALLGWMGLALVDDMPMKAPIFAEGLRQLGIPEEVIANIDQKLAKAFALQRRCLSGDPQAIKLWLEQIGEHVDTIKHEGLPQQNGDLVLAPKKKD